MRAFITLLVIAILILNITSCKEKGTEPQPEPKPPGYQEDIPWPSLADSPWPMYRADPQNTGRSKGFGPQSGNVSWTSDSLGYFSSISLGYDSTIYVIVMNFDEFPAGENTGLFAFNLDGTIKWKFNYPIFDEKIGGAAPIVLSNGGIIVNSPYENKLYCVNNNGTKRWEAFLGNNIITQNGLSIDKDGNIYALGTKNGTPVLIAVGKMGEFLWDYQYENFWVGQISSMSISPDGKTLYIPGRQFGPGVIAIDVETQFIKWEFGRKGYAGDLLVDCSGNIYIITSDENNQGILYSLHPDGTLRWKYDLYKDLDNSWGYSSSILSLVMDKNGNLYTGKNEVISLDYSGKLRWQKEGYKIWSSISIDKNNMLYFSIHGGAQKELICMNENGELIFSTYFNDPYYIDYSPVLGYGTVSMVCISAPFFTNIK
ncbi:MAG: PQQ-binding-like beta-propeller repeat protein [Melioribacteraceae bacterium]|nr:PQQ-binding-like beta-propeller repeat protein [Melioribacteraceae bacterium]MCF8396491.1 PQQ-binding-like beta-propeller repeat protein [Melioribacteraceae bacterium]